MQVVYLSEPSGYVPVSTLRGRPVPQSPPYHTGSDLETWRPDPWDRDYNHRFRYNSTRVQRKFFCLRLKKLYLYNLYSIHHTNRYSFYTSLIIIFVSKLRYVIRKFIYRY